ncbi:MAG: magnesium/cobalt efflux protein, partial [Planctomycetes bacterium]|nr:magnesium/cobalt efflux protein [Planctomycetota bacterium]
IEDLLEEIVGEIEDEHDSFEDVPQIHSTENGEIVADGAFGIFDLNEAYQTKLPEDESYETLAGLLFDRLGHIPTTGESLNLPGHRLEVLAADNRRVQRVRIQRVAIKEDPQTESSAA